MTFARDLANFADVSAQNLTFRNKIINGDFGIWQRGTSFTANQSYNADRWTSGWDSSPTVTISRQSFTAGAAPVSGYENSFFHRTAVTSASSMTLLDTKQYIEDVRTFAGQTVTVSFWAKADASRNINIFLLQNFGSGGSGDVTTSSTTIAATTSWTRFTASFNVASISGKTIGSSSYLALYLRYPGSTFTIDIWGVQVEAGSSASAFEQRPVGTELALCQRYAYMHVSNQVSAVVGTGFYWNTSQMWSIVYFPVTMRTVPTLTSSNATNHFYGYSNGGQDYVNYLSLLEAGKAVATLRNATEASGTANAGVVVSTLYTDSFLLFSSEL
jgi:hypothetical protein